MKKIILLSCFFGLGGHFLRQHPAGIGGAVIDHRRQNGGDDQDDDETENGTHIFTPPPGPAPMRGACSR